MNYLTETIEAQGRLIHELRSEIEQLKKELDSKTSDVSDKKESNNGRFI